MLRVLVLTALLLGVQRAAAARPERRSRFRALVFTKTTGFRHDSIADGVARDPGASGATIASRWIRPPTRAGSPARTWRATTSWSSSPPPARRSAALPAARVRGATSARGGGFVGVHAASDTRGEWPWYERLVGARFKRHDPGTPARDRDRSRTATSAATRGLPASWTRTDEWYEFRSDAARVHVLASLDETRPLAWCHRYDGGRSVYTAMGHTEASFAEPRFLAPPARRDRDGRRPREVRLCAVAALARACDRCCAGSRAAAATRAAAEPRPAPRPRRRPRRRPTADERADAAAAAQRRLEPRDQLDHGRPRRRHDHGRHRPGAVPRRPRREGGRADRRARSRRQGSGTVSGNLVLRFTGAGRPARLRPPAGGRAAREPAADPLQRPRRDLAGRAGRRRATTTSSRPPATRSSRSASTRPTSWSAATAARRSRRARRRRRRSTSSSTPATRSSGRSRPSRARSSPPTAATPGARATRRSAPA